MRTASPTPVARAGVVPHVVLRLQSRDLVVQGLIPRAPSGIALVFALRADILLCVALRHHRPAGPLVRRTHGRVIVLAVAGADAHDLREDNVANLFCSDDAVNLAFRLNTPSCSRNGNPAIVFTFNQAKLTNRDYTTSIGQNATVRLTYSNQLQGISSNYLGQGVIFSGSYGRIPIL